LRGLGFDVVLDRSTARNVTYVRIRGGLAARLKFFHSTDPAITRKRDMVGHAIKSTGDLRVTSVEPLDLEMPMYDITTGTGDFVANGVISHNCFARNTHTYLDLDAGADFDTKVVVKVNAADLVRRELARPRWAGAHIAMGTNVDCYQRAEGRYRLMPGIITALREFANPFSILTKGTLILRDLDLLVSAARETRVGLAMSIGFVDESLWRSVESGTPSPRRRLDTVRRLTDAGFAVSVLMAPILPGLTDTDECIERTVRAIAAAGAASISPIPLHLRPGAREWYLGWLGRHHPHLLPQYRDLYGRGSYLAASYQRDLSQRVGQAVRRHGPPPRAAGQARGAGRDPEPGGSARSLPLHSQPTLF
jgi:DNA repair photolyase